MDLHVEQPFVIVKKKFALPLPGDEVSPPLTLPLLHLKFLMFNVMGLKRG
jgi:hypothetical protein